MIIKTIKVTVALIYYGLLLCMVNVVDAKPDVTPVSERTPSVRDAIVAAIDDVDAAADVTTTHLASITELNLRGKNISVLKTGDFSGLTALENLNLFNNQLSSLPEGIFEGLTSLKTLRLGRNAVDPLPFTVSLEKVAEGQFKAVAPAGATDDFVLPISVTNGSVTGGATSLTISHGSVESAPLRVTRLPSTTAPVTVDIGSLPKLPRNHYGYVLTKSDALPLTVISAINTAPVFTEGAAATRAIAENTDAAVHIGTAVTATDTENDALTWTLSGPDANAFDIDSSTGQLKTKAALDYETKNIYTVTITVSDGSLTGTITVTINITDIDEVVLVDPPETPPEKPQPPNTAPSFNEGAITRRTVLERTPAETHIGLPVRATDTAEDSLTYTLGGVDADAFDLDSNTGQLKTKAPLDYETKRTYSVKITVTDAELSDTILVVISIIDVSDTVMATDLVPVATRTPVVRDAIVAAIDDVDAAADVTATHLTTITRLDLRNKGISALKTGDFSGLTALENLNLHGNQLSGLPVGIFNGLTALISLRLGGNAVDPLPLIVHLQSAGVNAFKVIIPAGAPFNIVVPIRVTGGSLAGGITTVTVPQGKTESTVWTVIGTSANVSIGSLPRVPRNHFGYTLAQSTVLNRTPQVVDAIAKTLDVNDYRDITEVNLATLTSLDLSGADIASLRSNDFDGLISLTALDLASNKLSSLPLGVFEELASLRLLSLNNNNLTSLSGAPFTNLTSLTTLDISNNALSSLPNDVFDGLSSLTTLKVANNKLTVLPAGTFEGLTQLTQLQLHGNPVDPLPIDVSLQKVGQDQIMARVPIGAPWTLVLPIAVKNGESAGGVNVVTIPIGEVASQPLTIVRTPDTIDAVTVDFGTLPKLPAAHDGYALVKSGTFPLQVLEPLNSPPIFTEGASTTRSITENTPAGENIGDVVTATDLDTADTLTYTLGGTDAAAFDVDSTTGQLKTEAPLDYETQDTYSVVMTVSDGKLSDTITVSIVVVDIDENRAPVFSEDEITTREIPENTEAGQNIGTPISATDPDNDTLTYSLAGTDAAAFAINIQTGQLKTSTALDYETKTSYTVVLNASDGKLTTSITVIISVTDVVEEAPAVGTDDDEQPQTQTTDSPNNPPVFTEGDSTTRSVLEGTPTGVDIGTAVAATDADGHTLTYALGGTDAAAFTIDGKTGQLRTEAPLDYETKTAWTVTITAADGTLTATITVTINVIDLDETPSNNAPVFTEGDDTTRTIAENTGSGVDIGAPVAATDEDSSTLAYILSGTDAAAFSLGASSGQLRTEAPLDYETKTFWTVTITVNDGSNTDSIDVTINVTNQNESPVFTEGPSTIRSVPENTEAGQNIGDAVSATDPDTDDTLTYALSTTDAQTFSIVSTSGQLQTKAALDYETNPSWTVTITVSDAAGDSNSIAVTINVTPVNEAPVFTDGDSAGRTIAENTPANVNIGDAVSATDANNDPLIYTLGGTDAATFDIETTTGQLKTKGPLDFEAKASYAVTVSVSDGKGGTDSIAVTINVTDLEERAENQLPVFQDGANISLSIAENTPPGENIESPIAATDADNDPLVYLLGGTDAAAFRINDKTGQLQTNAPLDHEKKDAYQVTVIANDGSDTVSIAVTINVTDANDAPTFTDGDTATREIPENTPQGQNIGDPITATDADTGDTLTYSLTGTDADSFAIVTTSGQIQTKDALDYETKPAYSVTVGVSDGAGGSDSITVTINVTNVDENRAPVFTDGNSATREIPENTEAGQNIGDPVGATDADADTLTYSLGGTDADAFSINSQNGQIRTKTALDYEGQKRTYEVTVQVSDGKGGTDSITVTINVTDVQENRAPVFTDGNSATREIPENTEAGQNIGDPIGATDADADTLTYSLTGTDADAFSINSQNGQIRTKAALDYETKPAYSVTVGVSDGAGGTNSITVTINVTNVDENRNPVFTDGTSATREIPENTPSGQNIGNPIAATDADADTLTYSLTGTDANAFGIVTTSGQLQTKAALDYETDDSYSVTVEVSDGKGGSASIPVTINVTNANDAPIFTAGTSATRDIPENTEAGQNIGDPITATDADTGDTLTYSLTGTDADSFAIVTTSGQLQTKAALDYEVDNSYTVTVGVQDGNSGTDSITVNINITDVDETPANNAPEFTDGDTATREIPENTEAGQNIGDPITATDADTGDTLTYSLTGTDADSFAIVTTSGQLQTKAALDYENDDSYTVTVGVQDGNGGTDSITVTINVTDVDETPPAAQITPVRDRSKKVKNAIVDAVPGVRRARDVTAEHLAAITSLNVRMRAEGDELQSGDFDGLTGLTSLKIYDTWFTTFPAGIFDDLTALTSLNLGYGAFESVPSGLFDKLTALTSLDLSDGSFTSLPSDIFDKLTALTSLNLNGGDGGGGFITSLPSGIFDELTALTSLNLSDNAIASLPSGLFDKPTALTSLNLSDNIIASLPSGLFDKLTALTTLDLNSNLIDDLPAGIFDSLTALTTLDLSYNDLENVPADFFSNLNVVPNLEGTDLDPEETGNAPPALAAVPRVPTSLLANYPNPFNPETWIPFQLSKPTPVTVTIYDVRGVVIRELNLGWKPAGDYISRPHAAHWDGRNMFGEQVAAGIYFYTLTTDDFTTTRKMLIRK